MNVDLRRVFTTALPDEEPPVTTQATDLAAKGRRKHRRRRVGYTVSGAAFAVTAIAAVALIVPGPAAGPPDDDALPGGRDGTTEKSAAPADLPTLSEQTRAALKAAFPDVKFTMASGWAVGDEPFELSEGGSADMPYLVGYANVEGQGHELIGVELYSPGDFSTEAGTKAGGDRDADEYLLDCGSKDGGDTKITATCDSRTLDGGALLRTAEIVEDSKGETVGIEIAAVAYRTDDTAVVLRTECHDEGGEFACDKKGFDTTGEKAVEEFLVNAPPIPG